MKRLVTFLLMALALPTAIPSVAQSTDYSEASQDQGSYAMSSAEIANTLPPTVFMQSVEGQAYAAANPTYAARAAKAGATVGVTAFTTGTTHCYGQVFWRRGSNIVGITLWKVWNHSSWCGIPYQTIQVGSVYGHIDTYTCCLWSTDNESWNKRYLTDTSRLTNAHAKVLYGLNSNPIQSHTVDVTMKLYANGATAWGTW